MKTLRPRFHPVSHRTTTTLLAAALSCLPQASPGQSVGLYFDSNRISCSDTIDPFGIRRFYVIAQTPPQHSTTGILLALQAPPGLEVFNTDPAGLIFDPRNEPEVTGSLAGGLRLQYFPCFEPNTTVALFEFDIFDRSFGGRRPDLQLHLVGAAPDSSANNAYPQFLICDPDDPNGHLGLVDAVAHDAWLNCTTTCNCTTPIESRTWSAIKKLFMER